MTLLQHALLRIQLQQGLLTSSVDTGVKESRTTDIDTPLLENL